ncbi:MAG: hypothetical protein WCP52_08145 [Bacteroidota bacterium]
MNKKQLRKDLELALVKNIEDLLISIQPEACKEVDEIIFGASRIIAKKFYKSIKFKSEKSTVKKETKKTNVSTSKTTKTKANQSPVKNKKKVTSISKK